MVRCHASLRATSATICSRAVTASTHAEASEIAIALTIEEQRLTITVSDNGVGFQRGADANRHGLTSMDDRIRSLGGDLFITSGGAGTVIRASLPLDPRRAPLSTRQGGDVLPGIEQVLAETAGAGVFVGREREIETLRNLFEEAAAGRGRMVLLSGEAGIGKTRTANELATYASSRGAEVLVGRCYEGEGAPAYWPWIQVLRAYVRGRDPAELSALMGPGAADISQILPELSERIEAAAAPAVNDPRQARFRLFDSITSLLAHAAAARPLVVILDDLQSADTPSLLAWLRKDDRALLALTSQPRVKQAAISDWVSPMVSRAPVAAHLKWRWCASAARAA